MEVRTTENFSRILFCVTAFEGTLEVSNSKFIQKIADFCEAASSGNYFRPLNWSVDIKDINSTILIKNLVNCAGFLHIFGQISFCIFYLHSPSRRLNILQLKAAIIQVENGISDCATTPGTPNLLALKKYFALDDCSMIHCITAPLRAVYTAFVDRCRLGKLFSTRIDVFTREHEI